MTERALNVMLDPGHSTAPGYSGAGPEINEGGWNWAFQCYAMHRLTCSGEPYNVRMSRALPEQIMTLAERGEESRMFGANYVISIHVDCCGNSGGLKLYHWPGNVHTQHLCNAMAAAAPYSLKYGKMVWAAYDDPTITSDDWIENPRAVIAPHIGHSILIEVGDMLCENDKFALNSDSVKAGLASMIEVGLCAARIEREVLNLT